MDQVARGFIKRRSPVLAFVDARPTGLGAAETQPALRWLEDDPDVTILRKDCVNGFVGAIEAVHHGMHGTSRNRVVDWVNAHRLADRAGDRALHRRLRDGFRADHAVGARTTA